MDVRNDSDREKEKRDINVEPTNLSIIHSKSSYTNFTVLPHYTGNISTFLYGAALCHVETGKRQSEAV